MMTFNSDSGHTLNPPPVPVCVGCLLQFLRQRKELVEKTEIILDMATQVCAAMLYLEENGFIHRDLVSYQSCVYTHSR